jgi:uncharacterized membrane protein YdjX (TVP38/TMEM64 family)
MCILFWAAVAAVAIVIFAVLLPKALARPIQRLIALMMAKLTRQQLIAMIIGACALLPCTLILPMQPFIWIAGGAFDFGTAFGIVMTGCVVGMSMQYWAARLLFKEKVENHLLKKRKDGITVALRAVDIAGPWKILALIRLGPSPYAAMNYCFGVCPTIHFYQYIIASTLCTAHHRALSVFFGRSMPSLADLFSGKPVTDVGATVYRFILLALGITLCIVIVVLAKKALKKIEEQELEREAQEAAAAAAAAEAEAAAEAGTAGPGTYGAKERASLDNSKRPMPLAVEGKLAAAAAATGAAAAAGVCATTASSSDGDLQVIVVDDASTAQGSDLSLNRGDSLIPAGSPPAAAEAEPSASSRASSLSSLRGLLSSRFQRSS